MDFYDILCYNCTMSEKLTQHLINQVFIAGATPLESLVRRAYTASGELPDPTYPYFVQERVGQIVNGQEQPLLVPKFQTLANDGTVLGPLAGKLRQTGLDELSQVHLVRNGQMNLIGWRPLLEKDMSRIYNTASGPQVDRHRRAVRINPPGIFSQVSLSGHRGINHQESLTASRADEMLESDYELTIMPSSKKLALIGEFVSALTIDKLTDNGNGKIKTTEATPPVSLSRLSYAIGKAALPLTVMQARQQ